LAVYIASTEKRLTISRALKGEQRCQVSHSIEGKLTLVDYVKVDIKKFQKSVVFKPFQGFKKNYFYCLKALLEVLSATLCSLDTLQKIPHVFMICLKHFCIKAPHICNTNFFLLLKNM